MIALLPWLIEHHQWLIALLHWLIEHHHWLIALLHWLIAQRWLIKLCTCPITPLP
ncbi:hypothetical protein [Oceanobacillus kapialis]|uniref:Uncharacterized protein n=1 Tax=Oceanobacillus kapialis TaxID=481353 RepID=A0ABW5PVD3_9BACI